jgi:SRSO17 transposase
VSISGIGIRTWQHFLSRSSWDDAGAVTDLAGYVRDRLGHDAATVVLDETGDLKKGVKTVGVQRQYTGTAGRTENSQVAVYLGYRTELGYTLIDRELYLPESWSQNPERRAEAGVPADVEFATKGRLAVAMLERFFAAGGAAAWLTGDEVYGDCPHLREYAEERELAYVMAIGCNRHLTTATGRTARADELVAALSKGRWHAMSAGDGAKGLRLYDWAWITLANDHDASPGHRWLLARRNRTTGKLAYYRCFSTTLPRLGTLARVAGRRWSIEVNFQHAKTLVGLDQHQVRTWTSWRRWTTLPSPCPGRQHRTGTTDPQRDTAPPGLLDRTLPQPRTHPDLVDMAPPAPVAKASAAPPLPTAPCSPSPSTSANRTTACATSPHAWLSPRARRKAITGHRAVHAP